MEYTSIQVNKLSSLDVHQDKFNSGCNWIISMGKYQGGRLWIETEGGRHHPPNLPESPLRGTYHETKYRWVMFDPKPSQLNLAWAAEYP
eukprot:5791340-Amphidinium_carterae.1